MTTYSPHLVDVVCEQLPMPIQPALVFEYILKFEFFEKLFTFLKVSQIISGSLADCDGRLQVGDWLLSINGKSTIG